MNMLTIFSNGLFLLFIVGIPLYGAWKKIPVFDSFVEGGKEGFAICISLLPYLVAMLVAIGMLRASGFFTLLSIWMGPVLAKIGMPTEILPLALIRPFSGSASTGLMADLMHQFGGNSIIAKMAGTVMGCTETTFYVVAVYFGSVNIRRTRHAIPAGLLADFTGVLASVWICRVMFG